MTEREFTKKTTDAAATIRKDGWTMIFVKFRTRKATMWYGEDLGSFLNDYDEYRGSLEFHFSCILDLNTFFDKVNPRDIDWMYAA